MLDKPGRWCAPSGYLDWNESSWDAVVREVYEETSLYLPKYENVKLTDNDKQPFFVNTDPKENRQNVALNYCVIYDFKNGLPNEIEKYQNKEISQIKWVPLEYIIKYQLVFNHEERIKMAVEKFKNYLNG